MQPELRQLYQETILDHGKQPRNFREISPCSHQQEAFNPVCGDKLTLYLDLDDNNTVIDIAFKGQGCAISMASASIMTQLLKGKTKEEALNTFQQFHSVITQKEEANALDNTKLKVLSGVSAYPTRIKCATLAWHALEHALTDKQDSGSNTGTSTNTSTTTITTE